MRKNKRGLDIKNTLGIFEKPIKDKRAIEAIISTVFMIGITLSALGVVYTYVFPIIKEGVQKSQKCGEAQLYLDSEKGFTCYDSSTQQLQVLVQRGVNEYELGGVGISVRIGGDSSRYDVLQTPNPYVRMINGEYGGPIILPEANDGKVYVLNIDGDVEEVSIAPLIKLGNDVKTCDATSSTKEIQSCSAFIPLNFFVFKDHDTSTLNNKWGWDPTGFAASNNNLEFVEGSNSLQINGKGSAGFNPNIAIDKATTLRFSYKKDSLNPDAYISVFYHVSGNGADEWIEFTDAPGRGYKGIDLTHYNDDLWHTEQIALSSCQDAGQCANYPQKGAIDNFQFAVWDPSAAVYFDNVYFY